MNLAAQNSPHSTSPRTARIVVRAVSSDLDLELFAQHFSRLVGTILPADYMRRARVVAAFAGDEMVGGFMIVTEGPLRLLAVIPRDVRDSNAVLRSGTGVAELNGWWASPTLRATVTFALVGHFARELCALRSSYFLLGYNSQRPELAKLYDHPYFARTPIYSGPADPTCGLRTFRNWDIGMVTLDAFRRDPRITRYLARAARNSQQDLRAA